MKRLPPDGIDLIMAERERQITAEGWDSKHDDLHHDGELALAAACYALPDHARELDSGEGGFQVKIKLRYLLWPWDGWWKPTPDDRVRELVKAGALIAAEIDRLLRSRDDWARVKRPAKRPRFSGPGTPLDYEP